MDLETLKGTVNTAYSLVEAMGTQLQSSSADWGRRLWFFRIGAPLIDFGFLVGNSVFLWNNAENELRGRCEDHDLDWDEEKTMSRIKIVAAGVGILALSTAIVIGINRYMRPTIPLQEIFNQAVTLPAEHAPAIAVRWTQPVLQVFHQWVLVNRIIVHLTSAFLSNNPALELSSAALQTLSFINVSRMKWMALTRTDFDYPLSRIPFEIRKSTPILSTLQNRAVEKIETAFEILVPSNMAGNTSFLQSTMQNVYDYSSNLFQSSYWDCTWHTTTQNGVEVSRNLVYYVTSKAGSLSPVEEIRSAYDLTTRAFGTVSYSHWGIDYDMTCWSIIKMYF